MNNTGIFLLAILFGGLLMFLLYGIDTGGKNDVQAYGTTQRDMLRELEK
jgi:hypothetical protein